eukprot:m.460416 g.460416  ORF g.460416 m.460416 type:complete len:346 (-) comp21594_c0_seq4:1204-2241(-)
MEPIGPSRPPSVVTTKPKENKTAMIGPTIPQSLTSIRDNGSASPVNAIDESTTESPSTLSMTPKVAGPSPPQGYKKSVLDDNKILSAEAENEELNGGSMAVSRSMGPSLPPGFVRKSSSTVGKKVVGPARPPQEFIDHVAAVHNTIVGPLPAAADEAAEADEIDMALTLRRIQDRADATKQPVDGAPKPSRETWMTNLPDLVRKDFGTKARQFRAKAYTVDSDTSAWTETPADRERKLKDRLERRAGAASTPAEEVPTTHISDRDARLREQIAKHNEKKRSASLMDMHAEKRQKSVESGTARKFKFNRETDLDIRTMKSVEKKGIMDRAQSFNSRFAPSAQKQFL